MAPSDRALQAGFRGREECIEWKTGRRSSACSIARVSASGGSPRRLGMSRTTVIRLLALAGPPRYERQGAGTLLDPHRDEIAAMLGADPTVPATVIREHLVLAGYTGGITILKDHLAQVRPAFTAARAFQRTSYLPGEIVQLDWWHTGVIGAGRQGRDVPGVRPGREPAPLGCPHGVFTLSLTVADFVAALPAALARLGGVAEKAVCDNDASIVARREGGRAQLHREVEALFGALRCTPVVLRPRRP
jgi:hypothetical protein